MVVAVASLAACGAPPNLLPKERPPQLSRAAPDGNGQTGTVGAALPVPLRVRATHEGLPVEGTRIQWRVSGSGAEMQPSVSVTGPDGIASTTWLLPRHAGPKFAVAAVLGPGDEQALEFTADALPDVAERIIIESGADQFGTVGEPLPTTLRVRVADRYDNPVGGIAVTWQVTAGGGAPDPAGSITDATGSAAVAWTLGPVEGTQSLVARLDGMNVPPIEFTAVATPVPIARVDVMVSNLLFYPASITISPGTSVAWTMVATGAVPHSVRSNGATRFTSSPILLGVGSYFTHTFTEPGVYQYDCAVHGAAMTGTITVQ